MSSLDRRSTLLGRNAGHWEGTFIRLDDEGLESERFGTQLQVQDTRGQIEAALTYLNTGKVATMRFAEPPALMAISPEGHWSLGPDKTGPWPAVMELCLVDGQRRRRVVVRHGAKQLESVVLVVEARPGVVDPAPAPPLLAAHRRPHPHHGPGATLRRSPGAGAFLRRQRPASALIVADATTTPAPHPGGNGQQLAQIVALAQAHWLEFADHVEPLVSLRLVDHQAALRP